MDAGVPAWANEYVGIPFKTKGRDRNGCDCWGLLALVWRERLGHDLPAYNGLRWGAGGVPQLVGDDAQAYAAQFDQIPPGEERLGDGILIRMRGHPLHVGLVLTRGWMLHSHECADSCIESYDRIFWRHRILGFYRYNGR